MAIQNPVAQSSTNKYILQVALGVLKERVIAERAQSNGKGKGRGRGAVKPLAIVFDIDGTAIYNHSASEGHRRNPDLYAIYQYAIENNILVFFLTARPDTATNRAYTIEDLRKSGYTPGTYHQLIMRPNRETHHNYSAYKYKKREDIAQVFNLLMSVGDTKYDMVQWITAGANQRVANQAAHGIVEQLKPNFAYVLVLPETTPSINVKLKEER
jgi:predicted secreted acid phosphatase